MTSLELASSGPKSSALPIELMWLRHEYAVKIAIKYTRDLQSMYQRPNAFQTFLDGALYFFLNSKNAGVLMDEFVR